MIPGLAGHRAGHRLAGALVVVAASRVAAAAPAPAYCRNAYAEDLAALSTRARDAEAGARSYSYAVRTTATYECVSYAGDGSLRKSREVATAHGTAFGFRRDGSDTLLVTNDHVAQWPAVTDAEHPVDGVPAGCKRVADALKIVDDDRDRYAADDIPLSRVAVDPELDVAILRAHATLQVIPWRIGRSAALAPRAVVEVKGFPLGAFQATNVGKVISAYDHDDQGAWNHDDFVIDALLSPGGSGSPVLAVSCQTGEFELVGIYHAHYSEGSALHVVVAIDQVRGLMATLERSPRPDAEPALALDPGARARVAAATRGDEPPFFPFGSLVASVRAREDGALVFTVFDGEFPRSTEPLLVVEDLADGVGFGRVGTVSFRGAGGLRPCSFADADTRSLIARTVDLLRRDALAMFDYRAAAATPATSRGAFEALERKRRALGRFLSAQHDASQVVVELASCPAPHTPEPPAAAISSSPDRPGPRSQR